MLKLTGAGPTGATFTAELNMANDKVGVNVTFQGKPMMADVKYVKAIADAIVHVLTGGNVEELPPMGFDDPKEMKLHSERHLGTKIT